MEYSLLCHPDSTCAAVSRIDVEMVASREGLKLRYRVAGDIAALRLPTKVAARRADNLWQHTCFEMFVADASGAYVEFNFSPSTQWAAYRFAGYRTEMSMLDMAAPKIEAFTRRDRVDLSATLVWPLRATSRVGLCAVVETVDGGTSYWALKHSSGQPDFHQVSSFIASIPTSLPT